VKHVRVVKIILGLVLLFSGIAKITDPSKAVNLMLEFKIIPEALILPVVSILPVLEILIGVLLVAGMYPKFASISALVLFSFGSVIKSRIGWGMVVRNGVFVVGGVYVGWKEFSIKFVERKLSADN